MGTVLSSRLCLLVSFPVVPFVCSVHWTERSKGLLLQDFANGTLGRNKACTVTIINDIVLVCSIIIFLYRHIFQLVWGWTTSSIIIAEGGISLYIRTKI